MQLDVRGSSVEIRYDMDDTPDLQLLHRSMELIVSVAERVLPKSVAAKVLKAILVLRSSQSHVRGCWMD